MSNLPLVYVDTDGVPTYRASGIYACHNVLLITRLGLAEPASAPEWLQQRYNAGHEHEPLILNRLRERHGVLPTQFQETVTLDLAGKARIKGHVDGIGTWEGSGIRITHLNGEPYDDDFFEPTDLFIIEGKALSQASFEKWCSGGFKGFPYYGWQASAYGAALGMPVLMAVKNKNTDELRVEMFTRPYVSKGVLFQKILAVEEDAQRGPEAVFAKPCDINMWPCPYFYLHPEKPKSEVADHVIVADLATQYDQARSVAAQADADQKAIGAQLVEAMGRKEGSEPCPEIGLTVSAYKPSGRASTNWVQMKKDFPGLDPDNYKTPGKKGALTCRVTATKEKKKS